MSPGCRTGAKLHLCGDAFSIADAQKLLRRAHGKSSKAGAWPISVCRAFPDPSSVGFTSFFKAVPAPSNYRAVRRIFMCLFGDPAVPPADGQCHDANASVFWAD